MMFAALARWSRPLECAMPRRREDLVAERVARRRDVGDRRDVDRE